MRPPMIHTALIVLFSVTWISAQAEEPELFPWRANRSYTDLLRLQAPSAQQSSSALPSLLQSLSESWPAPQWQESFTGRISLRAIDQGSSAEQEWRDPESEQRLRQVLGRDLMALSESPEQLSLLARAALEAGQTYEQVTQDNVDHLVSRFWFKRAVDLLAQSWGYLADYSEADANRLAGNLLRRAQIRGGDETLGSAARNDLEQRYLALKARAGNHTVVLRAESGWLFVTEQTRHVFGEEVEARVSQLNQSVPAVLVFDSLPETYAQFIREIRIKLSQKLAPIVRAIALQRLLRIASAEYFRSMNPFMQNSQSHSAQLALDRTALYERVKATHFVASQSWSGEGQELRVSGSQSPEFWAAVDRRIEQLKTTEQRALFRQVFGVDDASQVGAVVTLDQRAQYEVQERELRRTFLQKLHNAILEIAGEQIQTGSLNVELRPIESLTQTLTNTTSGTPEPRRNASALASHVFTPSAYDFVLPLRQQATPDGVIFQMAIEARQTETQFIPPADTRVIQQLDQLMAIREQGFIQYLAVKKLLEHARLVISPQTQEDSNWPIRSLNVRQALHHLIRVVPLQAGSNTHGAFITNATSVLEFDLSELERAIQ